MQLWEAAYHLTLFSVLVLPTSYCSTCPQQCSCTLNSIFCTLRKASSIPLNLPPTTKQLYVFQNGISSLQQQDFGGLVNLIDLDLSQNKLAGIPDKVFGSLTTLHNLDLSSNLITHISKDSFAGLVNLRRLYLHGNRIQIIHSDAFEGLEHLLELKLQENLFTILPILHLPRLLLLDISQNKIPAPGPDDLHMPHLESLYMAGLGLTNLDEGLMRSLNNLHDLDVSRNKLGRIPSALRLAKGLIRLNLAGNPLGPLREDEFQNMESLQKIDLSSLNLQGFPVGFFQMFPRLTELTIAENPFNCYCQLAWFPNWLKDKNVVLGRRDETRCHFPPINAGRVLTQLEPMDFGCPTTFTEQSVVITSSRMTNKHNTPDPTIVSRTTHTVSVFPPSKKPPDETTPNYSEEHVEHTCPPSICLNGGTCRFDQRGQVDCLCPPDTSGTYCENQNELQSPAVATRIFVVTSPAIATDISSHHVTGTSISLNLHRYIESRPNIRGIRLTYRNLSGPDRRPLYLNVPASYPEYTLRGLHPNCTYFVCASPLGEPMEGAISSCMEARTGILQFIPSDDKPETFTNLVPIMIVVAVVMGVALIALVIVVVLCRSRSKTPKVLDLAEPSPFELEGVKACLENSTMPQKHSDFRTCPLASQNGIDYEVPLIQEHFVINNNTDERFPTYF